MRYALKRLLLVVPTLLLVTVFVFGIVRAIPGDVVDMMREQFQYGRDAAELRARLGLDRPLVEQYLTWVGGVARGDSAPANAISTSMVAGGTSAPPTERRRAAAARRMPWGGYASSADERTPSPRPLPSGERVKS